MDQTDLSHHFEKVADLLTFSEKYFFPLFFFFFFFVVFHEVMYEFRFLKCVLDSL